MNLSRLDWFCCSCPETSDTDESTIVKRTNRITIFNLATSNVLEFDTRLKANGFASGNFFWISNLDLIVLIWTVNELQTLKRQLFQNHGKVTSASGCSKRQHNQCEDAPVFLWVDFVCFRFSLRRAHTAHFKGSLGRISRTVEIRLSTFKYPNNRFLLVS